MVQRDFTIFIEGHEKTTTKKQQKNARNKQNLNIKKLKTTDGLFKLLIETQNAWQSMANTDS